jgi:hypothetical protein
VVEADLGVVEEATVGEGVGEEGAVASSTRHLTTSVG